MAGPVDDLVSPFGPLEVELARMKKSNLTAAIDDVDHIIGLLMSAREQVVEADTDSHRISMAMTALQSPIKSRLEKINDGLKEVTKAQRGFGKALDKALPHRDLPMETDAMADHQALINRAIAMHLLREGQFSVATTFVQESRDHPLRPSDPWPQSMTKTDEDGDDDMTREDDDVTEIKDFTETLQGKFAEMYEILSELRRRNLGPAIKWAHENNTKLQANGSTLEFELCTLQYVWLFRGTEDNGLPDDENNGPDGAVKYARLHFIRFLPRHGREILPLVCARLFASNLDASPYGKLFQINSRFEDVSSTFTREFCSLLGLSAESPLYVAVTAGSIALPRLIKYTSYMKEKKTEWTTENELAFETPLPPSMIYHPIFVCPVSKEQTTDRNPPMMLTCGHVLCRESLQNIAKNARYKCPYCPTEGQVKDAIQITL